jgi:lipid A disaccharide synthetase
MIIAYPTVPVGAPVHESGGDCDAPSQVYVVARVALLAPGLLTVSVPLVDPPVVVVWGAVLLLAQAIVPAARVTAKTIGIVRIFLGVETFTEQTPADEGC